MARIYKIVPHQLWQEAERRGAFLGAPVDERDGFIHLSAADQLRQTAAKHFAGQQDLVLVEVEAEDFGTALRWEVSRGGALFPHLYGPLPVDRVRRLVPLPVDAEGQHQFPEFIP